MKKRNLFVLGLAILAFTACSDDNALTGADPGGGGNTAKNEEAWIALNIKTSGTGLRELHNPDKENGTEDESNVQTVRAIFFNLAKNVVADKTLVSSEIGIPGQSSSVSGSAFKISKDAKYLLLVINPGGGFPASFAEDGTVPYTTVNNVLSNVTVDAVTKSGANRNNFMMTNAKGGLEPSYSLLEAAASGGSVNAGDLKELTLYNSSTEATGSPVEINVDRVVAKVRLYDDGVLASSTGNAEILGWVLNVTNKQFYPASERTMTKRETLLASGSTSWIWSDMYHLGSYRKDPNYDYDAGGTAPVWTVAPNTAYKAAYNYFTSTAPAIIPGSWNGVGGTEYCLENTQSKDGNVVSYTTQVLLQAKYSPKSFTASTYDDVNNVWTTVAVANVSPTINWNWLQIGSGIYNFETLWTWLVETYTKKYQAADPDTYDDILTTTFNSFLNTSGFTQLPRPSKAVFDDTEAAGGYDGDIDKLLAAVKLIYGATDLLGVRSDIIAAGSKQEGSVTFYADGVNYYRIMIEHDNVKTTNPDGTQVYLNELGEFGVVRNSVYDIHVEAINKSGYPTIPDPDPGIKDEDEDQWVAVKININPWTWYKQGVIL